LKVHEVSYEYVRQIVLCTVDHLVPELSWAELRLLLRSWGYAYCRHSSNSGRIDSSRGETLKSEIHKFINFLGTRKNCFSSGRSLIVPTRICKKVIMTTVIIEA
jgi:hypothetical protein